MASVNKVILIGHLGRDPEVRTFQNGDKVCNLNIATSERWKDRGTGERRERTEWHRVAIFGSLAGLAERYLRKGALVYLEGALETRKWQGQNGQDRYSTEVVLRPYNGLLRMLDKMGQVGGDAGGPDAGGTSGGYSGGYGTGAEGGTGGAAGGAGHGGAAGAIDDDEIPF